MKQGGTPVSDGSLFTEGMFIHEWQAIEHFDWSLAHQSKVMTDFQTHLSAYIINIQLRPTLKVAKTKENNCSPNLMAYSKHRLW